MHSADSYPLRELLGDPRCIDMFDVLAPFVPVQTLRQVAYDPNTPPDVLARLAEDRHTFVRWHVACNPSTPIRALEALTADHDTSVRVRAIDTVALLYRRTDNGEP